ncbi:hypothetical protein L1987_87135 [Smallanthus sonchifolius]|nr:hypothetical protein L1987_87135 [Smallanthus sonchifolius]
MSILTCFFLCLIIPYAASISFNFTYLTPSNKDVILSGDAAYSMTEDGIQVTYKTINRSWEGLAGRATYIRPLHLWNNDTTDLASFSTSFTFAMKSQKQNNYIYGDGLTFFLAQNNSLINAGGSMGLPFIYQNNTNLYPFVAVEFDTYTDEWDPSPFGSNHVGINNKSLISVAYRNWQGDILGGSESRASINYDSVSKNISVSFTSLENNSVVWETGLDYTIDLRDVLPEWVIFGFSASTGDGYEENKVKSWMFNSTVFKGEENNGLAPTKNIDQSSIVPTTNNIVPSSSVPQTVNFDQSNSVPTTTTTNVGKMGLIGGSMLVLVFHYMAVL